MRILPVPYFKQDTEYTCGPTSLQMVLAYFHIQESENNLAIEMETNADVGTRHTHMIQSVLHRGLHCYVNDNATINELIYLISCSIPVIVRFLDPSDNGDHYGVVIGASESTLIIHDPWNGAEQHHPAATFINRWTCNEFGDCAQWLMAISPNALPIGHQYHPHD